MESHAVSSPESHHFVGQMRTIGCAAKVQRFTDLPRPHFAVGYDSLNKVKPEEGLASHEVYLQLPFKSAAGLQQPIYGRFCRRLIHVDRLLPPLETVNASKVTGFSEVHIHIMDAAYGRYALKNIRPAAFRTQLAWVWHIRFSYWLERIHLISLCKLLLTAWNAIVSFAI
jgi:hypothetical protein